MTLPRLLAELLSLPTAPFVEHAVLQYIRDFLAGLTGIRLKTDIHGNLLAHYRTTGRKPQPPIAFTAHTDHPGFAALRMDDPRTLRAAFRGWVEPEYFSNAGVRFWGPEGWIRGRVREISRTAPVVGLIGRTARPEEVLVDVEQPVPVGAAGMWDLPDPALAGDHVTARGCDDIAGVAAMLALLERLSERKPAASVYCLFTRAEEVGFIGAIGAAKTGTLPRKVPIVAIETSKQLPNARIGEGPILRVGDKSSAFTPAVTNSCDRVARKLAESGAFRYQRKLMDGGTCESTAYLAYGYPTTGICVALGNYHNMDESRRAIGSEYISLADWNMMVDWFEALAVDKDGFDPRQSHLQKAMEQRFAKYRKLLTQSRGRENLEPRRRGAAKPRGRGPRARSRGRR